MHYLNYGGWLKARGLNYFWVSNLSCTNKQQQQRIYTFNYLSLKFNLATCPLGGYTWLG